MNSDFLGSRRKALEDCFFAQQDRKLLEQLQAEQASDQALTQLSWATGIQDQQALQQMANAGITAETAAALTLVPLLEVAMADGDIQDAEREAILKAAAESGMDADGAAAKLLDGWLAGSVTDQLKSTWREYVEAITAGMSADQKQAMAAPILARVRKVAEAAGGFFGFGDKVSAAEEKAMQEIEQVFT